MLGLAAFTLAAVLVSTAASDATSQAYTWKNVVTGGGGGFIPNVVFNPSKQGLAYRKLGNL
jgi:xyloglucan-specific exo-beta-1,4-glucanase